MLGGRTDLSARVIQWLADGYLELGWNYPFETLEDTIVDTTSAGVGSGEMLFPDPARGIMSITLRRPDGITIPLKFKDVPWINRYPTGPGFCSVPAVYATHNTKILLRPEPDASYDLLEEVWLKPVIAEPPEDTDLLIPDDWLEILDYLAAMRGHVELLERDKANEIHALLYGYRDLETKQKTPGLIHSRMLRRQAQAPAYDYGLQPQTLRRGYTAGK
jgi:hypothetical protein